LRNNNGNAVIREETIIKGKLRNVNEIEVFGYIEGELDAKKLIIRPGGKVFGTISVENAEILGTFQGDATIKNLIAIRTSGTVNGNVRYGKLAMEDGANLSADVRNIPPDIAGDLDITVSKGRTARVTTMDLTAIDPDDSSEDLVYTVTKAVKGAIVLSSAPQKPVTKFKQADIEAGEVMFLHDGSQGPSASFDVVVTDSKGANSGPAQTVKVNVRN